MGDFFISAQELSRRLAIGEPLRIFDVRRVAAIEPRSRFLPGSRWRNHLEALDWGRSLSRDDLVVLNCMHGHNVSQIATAVLRDSGYNARALKGGVDGWIEAGLPTVGQNSLCPVAAPPSVWVTRINPQTDRVACTWLIRRFIDPDGRILFVEPDWVIDIAKELGGISFDAPGADIEHDGNNCSLGTLLRAFDFDDPGLSRLAAIVAGTDADHADTTPEAAGLEAIMLGNCFVATADHHVMQLGFPVYDALYARMCLASGEHHGWRPMKA